MQLFSTLLGCIYEGAPTASTYYLFIIAIDIVHPHLHYNPHHHDDQPS